MGKNKDNCRRKVSAEADSSFGVHSLKGRVLVIMLVSILLWLLFVLLLFMQNYHKNQEELENQLSADTAEVALSMDRQYTSLLKISQQMTNNSVVGNSFEEFLTTSDRYDRIRQTTQLQTTISSVIFNYDYGTMACYYSVWENGEEEVVLSNYPVEEKRPSEFCTAVSINDITYQSLHDPLNIYLHVPVVSIIRDVYFDGKKYLIYVESSSADVQQRLQAKTRAMEYTFLQLDDDGKILWILGHQDQKTPPIGTQMQIDLHEEYGICSYGGESFVYCVQDGLGGKQHYAMLVRKDLFLRQQWEGFQNFVLVMAIGIAIVIVIVITTLRYIYLPVRQLGEEMEKTGKGELAPVDHYFGMDEFDNLYERFNEMKLRVAALLEDVRKSEYEKQNLEMEKLYYQINPHFLLNALHSLHWMAAASHQKEIDEYIYQLNFILGYSLGKTEKRATFATELKSFDVYVDLQKKRYDFEVHCSVEEGDWLQEPCARLILQPLAENAICHNMNEFGNLWLTMLKKEDGIHLEIRDDGPGFVIPGETAVLGNRQNSGIGLRYVQMSLQSYYDGKALFRISSDVGKGTSVRMILPLEGSGVHRDLETSGSKSD